MIRVTWTGAAGLQFETGEETILIDPYHFSKPHVPGAKTRPMPFTDLPGMLQRIRTHAPCVEVIVPEMGQAMVF